jgi:hypothetical protein
MERKLLLENATPTTTAIEGVFDAQRFTNHLSATNYGGQRFVVSPNRTLAGTCQQCIALAGGEIVATSGIHVRDENTGVCRNLMFRLLCFGTVPANNGASNACEFIGDSGCFSRTEDVPEETVRDGLDVIHLERDYQVTGGVVRTPEGQTVQTGTGITLGRLRVRDRIFYTIEPQWLANASYISCIPEGTYFLRWNLRTGSRWRDRSFDLFTEDRTSRVLAGGRQGIVIHQGNYVSNTEGCIILGNSIRRNTSAIGANGHFALSLPTDGLPGELRGIIGDEGYIKITSGSINAIRDTIV